MKMTERSARWMESVVANCEANTGRPLAEWVKQAKRAKLADAKEARAWCREQGLSIVYATAVVDTLFPQHQPDDSLVDAQYAGPKAGLRPIYDALAAAARALGKDVEIMPRSSQVTFSRARSFAVVRAATRDRIDLALKLPGAKATGRLVANAKAQGSDPTHLVAVRTLKEVDREVRGWLRAAYEHAGAAAK
jgi:hypothetical protein